jgi:signal transduction histidine kinase/CheY-like chemotaxis protein
LISYRLPQSRAIIEAVLVKLSQRFWLSSVALKPHVQFHPSKKALCNQQRALISAKMVLSMPTPSLKEFAQTIPICQLTSGLATVLELFCTSGCEVIVVVSEKLRPLGIISLRQVLPYLISNNSKNKPLTMKEEALAQPISHLKPSIIEPLSTLPAQLNLSQFWAYIQQPEPLTKIWKLGENTLSQFSTNQHWALVDEQDNFLGLLDNCRLLNFFASKFTATSQTETQETPQRQKIAPLLQLLEQLPLPLSLQTVSGEILAQNPAWQTQIGTSPDSNLSHRLTDSFLNSPIFGYSSKRNPIAHHHSETLTQLSLRNDITTELQLATRYRSQDSQLASTACNRTNLPSTTLKTASLWQKPLAVTQRYCALDTPHMAAAVSQRRIMLSTIAAIENPEGEASVEAVLPTKESRQNKSFSLIKIPLSPSLLQLEPSWEDGRISATQQKIESSVPDLLLVIAQDTTEHQQVTKELAAKNADLVQLNRLKDEFLACISHELKTPLTAVLGLSSLLKDQTIGPLNERQSRYTQLIYHSGRQLMTVVNDILDLTRMETGQLELTLEPVQIQSVCDRAYSQAQQRPSEKNQQDEDTSDAINFTLSIEPGLELLVADELRLRQMLMHLLSNALKFTEPRGEIGLQVSRWEGWIAFTVWDTGMGIPNEKQHLIFQKFQQLEQPLTRRHEGTGLGLVLTQRLARLHGGDISFISKAGVGSQFTLLLPPTPPQESSVTDQTPSQLSPLTASKPAKSPDQALKNNRLVLLVETVPQYLEDLTQQLNNLAYRVVIARSGTEAIEKARSLQPCAILLNPLLPQLSGWDVLTLLKSDAQTCHIPAIVTATQAEKKQAYHNKADGFLSLPVQEQALLQSLTNLGERSLAPSKRNLTIMHLSPVLDETVSRSSVLSCELTAILNDQNSELNYRILEADDLDQAALLTRVWHPDVILLDSGKVPDPFAYMAEFSTYSDLTALPLVTLDHQTTEAANQVCDLTVYPCLAADNACKVEALLEVLQVAAGMNRKPSILVMDIKSDQNLVAGTTPTSSTSWRQALIQYLETAGFRSILSLSWAEVHRQLQDQNVDLVLLRIKDDGDAEALLEGLSSLAQLPIRPPIFVLDQRLEEVRNHKNQLTSELEPLLARVATQMLPGSVSMSQLLHQINQILAEK